MNPEKDYLAINKALWNAKTPIHIDSNFYDIPSILKGKSSLIGPDRELLNDLKGKRVLHLQCHFGLDSLSLARLGADVTALDFSESAIERARELYKDQEVALKFVCTDVYSARRELEGEFDVIYTSYGTIGWLPDVDLWAKTIASLLVKGGQLIFAEFHPVVWMFSDAFDKLQYSYFNRAAIEIKSEGTYANPKADIQKEEISWNHPLGDVFTALLNSGLEIGHFKEYDYSPYPCFDPIVQISQDRYQIKGMEGIIPMMYSLVAQKLN